MAPSVISSFLGTRYFLQSKTFLPGWGPSCNRAGPKVPSFHCQEASQLVTLWSHSLPVVPKLIQLLQLWWLLRIACKDATSHGVTCSSFPFPLLVLWAEDLLMETRVSWRKPGLGASTGPHSVMSYSACRPLASLVTLCKSFWISVFSWNNDFKTPWVLICCHVLLCSRVLVKKPFRALEIWQKAGNLHSLGWPVGWCISL